MPRAPEDRIGAPLARRIALAAAGFREPRPDRPGARHVGRVFDRLGLVQIDSVNVLARAHTVPFFSRLGPYDPALLERAAYAGRRRNLFEYWGHEASLIRLDLHPLLRWRMKEAEAGRGIYDGLRRFAAEKRPFIDEVLREVERRGPVTAGELEAAGEESRKGAGGWWGWSEAKRAVEWLFWAGLLTTRTRRGFARVYDIPERVIPADILSLPTPQPADAHRGLVRVAARALGIATEPDLRDYFRLRPEASKAAVAALVEEGDLIPVAVEGWRAPAYLHRDAARPRRVEACALVSPFDPLVWERDRTERLFGFRYRIEIYTPAHKREHGYYCLPFLLGDRIAARVDLKADRAAGRLLVLSVHLEPGGAPEEVRAALDAELAQVAAWLGLATVVHGRAAA
ncbi:winged helix-turn-helix domain-containing protein [Enterovirga rhinocerotis]|uniref:winged helix-turn-helix domain-containing protein n=1 Tax=Enterovirga rhinocerotis TaxID=1339210 RepID=UPI003CCA8CA2